MEDEDTELCRKLRGSIQQIQDKYGYLPGEMNKVGQRIERERNEWTRRFENLVEHMVYSEPEMSAIKVVEHAAKVADLMQAKIAEKFGEME